MTEMEWIRIESKMKNLLAENDDLRKRLKNCVNCIIAKEKTIDEITMERIRMESKMKNLLAENDDLRKR